MENNLVQNWVLQFDKNDLGRAQSLKTLLTTGNGRIGINADLSSLDPMCRTGVFVAGFFDEIPRPDLDAARFNPFLISWSHMALVPGYKREACLVNAPDFLAGTWLVDGIEQRYSAETLTGWTGQLDMRSGEVSLMGEYQLPDGRAYRVEKSFFASMADETAVYARERFTPLNFDASLSYRRDINDNTTNFNISGIYQDTTDGTDQEYLRLYDTVKTKAVSSALVKAVRGRVLGARSAFGVRARGETARRCLRGETATVEKEAFFACSHFESKPLDAVCNRLGSGQVSYGDALTASRAQWSLLWDSSDLAIEGDIRAQLGIRQSMYMLLISACRSSSAVSVAAKGLTGEGYRGMVFWDTDIHMLPFFLYTQPKTARNILSFRCNTLDQAKEKARALGCLGACYPWETGISGKEECEDFLKLLTHQLHITSDIVYSMNLYAQTTGDKDFLAAAAPVYLETARFWASKGTWDGKQFNIPDVSGPDELHLECKNSAYVTNLAAHNIRLALEHARHLMELGEQTRLERIADALPTMKNADGLFEQFQGYFALEDRIVYEDSVYDIPAHTQTVKQADVIMLLFLLPHLATPEELRANWDYYEPRTTHTSSLSYGVHGILASRLGLEEKAAYYLQKSLEIDLYAAGNTCAEGGHLAANGMSWSAIVQGLCGISPQHGALSVSPHLPKGWTQVGLTLQLGGAKLRLTVEEHRVTTRNDGAEAVRMTAFGQTETVQAGDTVCLTE